jgi:hypothetical protein
MGVGAWSWGDRSRYWQGTLDKDANFTVSDWRPLANSSGLLANARCRWLNHLLVAVQTCDILSKCSSNCWDAHCRPTRRWWMWASTFLIPLKCEPDVAAGRLAVAKDCQTASQRSSMGQHLKVASCCVLATRRSSPICPACRYGFGYSEEYIRDFMRQTGTNPVIATKFGPLPWRQTANSLVNAAKGSLGRLGMEKVGLYMQHWWVHDSHACCGCCAGWPAPSVADSADTKLGCSHAKVPHPCKALRLRLLCAKWEMGAGQ